MPDVMIKMDNKFEFSISEFEYLLGLYDAIPTNIKEDPRPALKDKLMAELADNNDW